MQLSRFDSIKADPHCAAEKFVADIIYLFLGFIKLPGSCIHRLDLYQPFIKHAHPQICLGKQKIVSFFIFLIKRRAFLEHGTVSFLRLRRVFHGHIQIACHLAEYHLQADPGRFPFRKTCLTFFFDFFQTCQLLLRLVFFLQRSRNLLLQPFYRFF